SPGLRARTEEIDGLLGGGFTTLERAILTSGSDPCAGPARQWLSLARQAAPATLASLRRLAPSEVALQPRPRDARPDHFLFEGERVTGLVDFGAMAIESVAADLARLLSEWVGPAPRTRAETLAAYAAFRPLDEVETLLIPAFESSAGLLG